MFNIEKLDNLPTKLSMRIRLNSKDRYQCSWNYKYKHVSDSSKDPWTIIYRLLNNSVGKKYDDVYSKLCKQLPYEDRHWFINFFDSRYPRYYIDNDNLIQKIKTDEYKREYGILSEDFKIKKVHKETGHKFDDFSERWYRRKVELKRELKDGTYITTRYTEKDYLIGYSYKNRYLAQEEDFHWVITAGTKLVVSSRNDYRYVRHCADRNKKQKAVDRLNKLTKEQEEQKFREILNAKKLKDKAANDMVIIKHGFCPKTSFRNFI